jgi:hypothetical protein
MKAQIKMVSKVVCMFAWLLMMTYGVMAQSYEPFNYPANAAPGNGSSGWAGPWTANGSNVVAPGLNFPGLTTSGNALGGTPGSAATRLLQTPIAGAAGTSVVLQALIRSAVPGTPATQATLGNSPGGPGKNFIIGDLPQQDPNANKWGMQNDCGRYYSNVPVVANQTAYLVARIDFNVSGNNDRMRLWVQTTGTAVPYYTLPPDVNVMCNVNTFGGVFWQTQQNQIVDEIRVDAGYCFPPPANMIAWFPFDETTGPTATNLIAGSGNGTHINGPTPIPGMVSQALRFDGINDYVQSPSTALTNIGTGDFSIDAWIRVPANSTNSVVVIADKRDAATGVGYSFWLYQNRLGLQLADAGGPTNYSSTPIATLSDNQWHHVAMTVRRASTVGIQWYHNGAVIASPGNPTNRPGSLVNNSPLRIGTRTFANPLTGWFRGDIDELEIFNRLLAGNEVLSLYNAGAFGKCK